MGLTPEQILDEAIKRDPNHDQFRKDYNQTTVKQCWFAFRLFDERDLNEGFQRSGISDYDQFIEAQKFIFLNELNKLQGIKWIERLLALPERANAGRPIGGGGVFTNTAPPPDNTPRHIKAVDWLDIPEGRYAVTGEDGATDFYRVQQGKDGTARGGRNWSGKLFVNKQRSDEYDKVKVATGLKVLEQIREDGPEAASIRYGKELGACGVCGRTLTNEDSIAAGIGPICRDKAGF